MTILFISNLFDPYNVGGTETYLRNVAEALSKKGLKVAVATSQPYKTWRSLVFYETEQNEDITIYRFCNINIFHGSQFPVRSSFQKFMWRVFSYFLPLNALVVLNAIIKKEKPAIIHTHNLQGFPFLVLFLLKRCGIPIVHTLHDYYFLCPRLSLLHRNGKICDSRPESGVGVYTEPPKSICMQYRRVMRSATTGLFHRVIAPSDFVLQHHKQNGLFEGVRGIVIPLGSTFEERTFIRKTIKSPRTFLYIGALSSHKGMEVFLEALHHLEKNEYALHVAGTGEFQMAFRSIANSNPRVRFHGYVSGKEKECLFEMSDCLVVPSVWYDNSPVVIYEAFSYGLPVIAANIGGIPELVKDSHNGFLFTPGSSNELAEKMRTVIDNPQLTKRLSSNALNTSKELLFERHVTSLLKIYHDARHRDEE